MARFVPDEIRNEPINIGVILQPIDTNHLRFKFLSSYSRVSRMVPKDKVKVLRQMVRGLQSSLEGAQLDQSSLESLADKFRHNLQFTEVKGVVSRDPESEVEQLFNRFVSYESTRRIRWLRR